MQKKKWISLFLAIVCLFAVTAGLLSGCKQESADNNKIQVSFDLNFKGAPEAPAAISVEKGKAYGKLPEVTLQREGFTFGGWYLNDRGKGEEVTANTVVTTEADHTLYAMWIGDKITVSFDLQGGNINGVSTVEDAVVTVGNVYSMMAIPDDPEKESNSFLGWFYDPEGTEGPVLTSTKVTKTEDHTLYAVWQAYHSFYDFEEGGKEIFSNPGNAKYGIEEFNGSKQLKISNPGTDKPDGTLVMWIPLKNGTRVTMDVTFAGQLPTEQARMNMFCYGVNASGVAITEGVIDITESETHRRWYHGNGYRAMQQNGVWFFGDEGNWTEGNTCQFEVIVMEDCSGLYMTFSVGSEMASSQYVKNAIYIDNIEMTPNYYRPLEEGMMGSSAYGATENGLYFTMKDNGLPFDPDWNVYYGATDPNNIKLVRDGKVYHVAEVGCDNICKFGAAEYYLRLEPYTIGIAAPISTTDMFIVEGDFAYGDSILNIKKTYIYHNGTAWVFTDILPEEMVLESEEAVPMPDPYYGILRPHDAGATDKGIYFLLSDNGLPFDADWNVYYDATSADNVKLIRDGKVYRIAEVGCDNITKFGKTDYYLRLESYTIGSYAPISTKDIFIVEGDFKYENSTLHIDKTYIYHDGTAWVFTTSLPSHLAPESEEVSPDPYAGILRSHEGGAADGGIHFRLSDNGLPYDSGWSIYYDATSTDNIKIIRGGKVYRAAEVGCDNICKFDKDGYYLRLEQYTIGGYAPYSQEDIIIVEGNFVYEDSTLNINKTYIYYNGSEWVFTTKLPEELAPETEEPVEPEIVPDGVMSSSPNGVTDQGIYFTMKDNGLPYGDWSVYYDATSADNIKIIRDGKVYSTAQLGCDNICKFSATDYYLRLESYTIGGYAPFSTEDIFVVEGDFTYEEHTLTIVKTYIYYNGSAWVFATELPEDLKPGEGEQGGNQGSTDEFGIHQLGVLSAHAAGVNVDSTTGSVTGIYATGAATGAIFNTNWSVEYTPAKAENYQLIRDGVTYHVGVTGSGTIVLFGQTELYLKQEGHTFGDGTLLPIRNGDILVVKGQWICNQDAESVLNITPTCILISDGTASFYEGEQDEEEGGEELGNNLGVLSAHDAGVNIDSNTGSVTGIYATGATTDARFNTDWSVEYTPAKAENYQLIRDGVTYHVGVTGSGTIVLFGQRELYLKQEGHTFGDGTLLPIRDGDILVVKGEWICNQDASSTITITKTCILISEGTATFYEGEPDEEGGEDTEEEVPGLTAHAHGVNIDTVTNSIKGIYAMCADNNAAFNTDWSVEYTPAAAENYKLIRDGVTYNVGVPGNGTIVLFGQTQLYLKQEAHTVGDGTLLPIRDGDVLVVEGQWNCIQDASSALTIDTTYILISESTAVFSGKLPEDTLPDEPGEEEPIDTKWTFDFDDGQVSTDIFKLRDSDLDMTVEELSGSMQLRLQPTVANGKYWLWLDADLKAGTVITLDVTFQRKLGTMNLYLYGAKENGDPITEGTVSDSLPQVWFDGQGVDADFTGGNPNTQTITFTVYEDCHGIAFMLGYGNKKPNVIYLDNITVVNAPADDESGNQLGVLAAHIAGVNTDGITGAVTGIYATGAVTGASFNTDWSVEYTPVKAENYQLIRDNVTYNVGVPGNGTIVLFGQTELYLKQEAHTVGDGTLLPIRDGDILVVEGQWSCNQDPSSVISIKKTYILIREGSAVFSDKEPDTEE